MRILAPVLHLAFAIAAPGSVSGTSEPAPIKVPSPPPGAVSSSAEDPARFNRLFAPYATEAAALSPDGKFLAYSLIEDDKLHIAVLEVDHPEKLQTKVAINSLKAMERTVWTPLRENLPLKVLWLAWVSSQRVAVLTETSRVGPALMAFDADGGNSRILATARSRATLGGFRFFGRSTVADCILLRTPFPRSSPFREQEYEYLQINTVTGKFTKMKEAAAREEAERARLSEKARKRDWKIVAQEVCEVLPDKRLSLIENDVEGVRFLGLVEGMSDPGSFYVIDRERRAAFDLVRRLPDDGPAKAPVTSQFEFVAADGQKVAGELCLPQDTKIKHVPVVVLMPEKLNRRVGHGFSREAYAFAQMGLATVRFDSFVPAKVPGSAERVHERQIIDQLVRMVDGLADLHPVSKRRIVLFGETKAGYLALRALQIYPERFTGAIVIDPNLHNWDAADRWPENAGKPGGPSGIRRAILALATASPNQAASSIHPELWHLVKEVRRTGAPAEFVPQPIDFRYGLPLARAAGFRAIERFVNTYVYDYVVKIGEVEKLPD